jgi:hypothetical protein
MAKLTGAVRKGLPSTAFVFPKTRKYPIHDRAHARDALARAFHAGPATLAIVRAAVRRRFPTVGMKTVRHTLKAAQ